MGTHESGGTKAGTQGSGLVKHPAKYSKAILHLIQREVQKIVNNGDLGEWYIIDPFGGVGGIFDLHAMEFDYEPGELTLKITCVEIEEEWAQVAAIHPRYRPTHDQVICVDFFDFSNHPSVRETYDMVIVSPTYGNRMADHHDAKDDSKRNTYKHTLGRDPSEGSSAVMQWGEEYRQFHANAWAEVMNLLRPGGYFLLNVKDHIRKGEKMPVVAWHKAMVQALGFTLLYTHQVATPGHREGENHELRVDGESVFIFQKPWTVAERTGAEFGQVALR